MITFERVGINHVITIVIGEVTYRPGLAKLFVGACPNCL